MDSLASHQSPGQPNKQQCASGRAHHGACLLPQLVAAATAFTGLRGRTGRRRSAHISRVWLSRVGARLTAVAVYVVPVRSVGAIARCIGCEPPPRVTLLAGFEHVRTGSVVTGSTRRQHGWLRAREGDTGRENSPGIFDVLAVGEANARQAGATIEHILPARHAHDKSTLSAPACGAMGWAVGSRRDARRRWK
jgi:hypothetical protein